MALENKKLTIGIAVILCMLFAYVGIRSVRLSMTHDEAYTYTRYVSHTYAEIIQYKTGNILPNNHVLNTIGQKFFSSVFGPKEWALRMGNVLTFGLYLVIVFCMARQLKGALSVVALVCLTMHPYLLDFMSLARGYGMAIAWMMCSMYFLLMSMREGFATKKLLLGLASGALTVWSNFSWLNFYLVVCPVYLGLQWLTYRYQQSPERKLLLWNLLHMLWMTILLTVVIYEPVRMIITRHMLFGGETGFWQDTVKSLCDRFSYDVSFKNSWMTWLQILIAAVLLVSVFFSIEIFQKKQRHLITAPLLFLTVLLFGMAGLSIAEHYLLDSYFPMERTALPFVPVFLLLMVYGFESLLAEQGSAKRISQIAAGVVVAGFFIHFIINIQCKYVLDWKYDANTKQIAKEIETIGENLTVGAHPLFEPALNFYNQTLLQQPFPAIHQDGYRHADSYSLFVIPDFEIQKTEQENLEILQQYEPSGTILARQKK